MHVVKAFAKSASKRFEPYLGSTVQANQFSHNVHKLVKVKIQKSARMTIKTNKNNNKQMITRIKISEIKLRCGCGKKAARLVENYEVRKVTATKTMK